MPDILQDLPIRAPREAVFRAISEPAGLDAWWTQEAAGAPEQGRVYTLGFGPGYEWRARVTRALTPEEFELELTEADRDWTGSRVGFRLEATDEGTLLRFRHTAWPEANEHYRISCHCWALYLRLLRRYVEQSEVVPYERRLEA